MESIRKQNCGLEQQRGCWNNKTAKEGGKKMTNFFKWLMGITAFNVCLQIWRANPFLEIAMAILLFFLTILASVLWEAKQ